MRNLILASTIAVCAATPATANVEYSANNAAVRTASQKNGDFITAKKGGKPRCGKKRVDYCR